MASEFEDNLLRDLLRDHRDDLAAAERPRSRSPRRRGLAGLAAAAVLVVGMLAFGVIGDSAPAFAVTEHPNGSVTLSVNDIRAIEPANERLRALGLRVRAVPTAKDCPPLRDMPFESYSGNAPFPEISLDDDSITIGAAAIPEGYVMVVNVSPYPDRGSGIGFTGLFEAPGPWCALDPADDPEFSTGD